MFFAFALTLIAVAGGALVTYLYDDDASLASRLCAGAPLGLAALGLVGFAAASLFGLTPYAMALAAALVAAPLLILRQPERRRVVRDDITAARAYLRRALTPRDGYATASVVLYAGLSMLLYLAFDRAMIVHEDGSIHTGAINNFGDLPFHLSVITSFAWGGNFPPEDPTFAGARFTYPFVSDFIAAMFVRAGADLRGAMLLENVVLGAALVGLLHRWGKVLSGDRLAALITPALVIFSGGLGWWMLWRDTRETGRGLFELLWQLPHDYTIIAQTNWRWGNTVTALLITQRSLLLGLPLALIVFTQWWASLREEDKSQKLKGKRSDKADASLSNHKSEIPDRKNDDVSGTPGLKTKAANRAGGPPLSSFAFLLLPSSRRMLAAGIVTGLLPLVHAHTFVVVTAMGGCLALLFIKEWRAWAAFFAASLVVALPQLWWVTRGSDVQTGTFFGWHFGWHREPGAGPENVFWFWFKNTGFFIPLLVAALLWRERLQVAAPPASHHAAPRGRTSSRQAGGAARAGAGSARKGKNTARAQGTAAAERAAEPPATERASEVGQAAAGAGQAAEARSLVPFKLLLFFLPFTLCFVVPNLVKLAPWEWDNIKVLYYWFVAAVPLVALLLARLLRGPGRVMRVAGGALLV